MNKNYSIDKKKFINIFFEFFFFFSNFVKQIIWLQLGEVGLSSSLKFKYLEGEIMFLISSLVDKILSMLRLIGQS